MIEKMQFLTITGPKDDFGRAVEQYFTKYEIHLENALTELKSVRSLRPFEDENPYKEALTKSTEYIKFLSTPEKIVTKIPDTDTACATVNALEDAILPMQEQQSLLTKEIDRIQYLLKLIHPFQGLQFDIKTILNFQFINFHFGRILLDHYKKLEQYVNRDMDSIFYKCHTDNDYVWGIYFTPQTLSSKVNAIYASLHFEFVNMPNEYEGTPAQAYRLLNSESAQLNQQMVDLKKKTVAIMQEKQEALYGAYLRLMEVNESFNLRKLAACTKENDITFYILCGWMTQESANRFVHEIENDKNIFCIQDEPEDMMFHGPPTKLKNLPIVRPFEMFTRMYGLPDYHEMDPTAFIALSYSLIFGAMFGDVGQGLLLFIVGLLIYKIKKNSLAAIISCAGVFSTIFGFLYGSVFGFEHTVEAFWIHPMLDSMSLPIFGQLNTAFVVAIVFGMGLILLTMIFHIINAMKSRDLESLLFDPNGLVGLIFYGSAVAVIFLFMSGKTIPAATVLVIMFVLPLVLIALKEPLMNLIERKSSFMPQEKGMFFIQAFFELFEILLSYLSNTLSFIRIGAFAVSHAAMMEVVLQLAGAEAGTPNWFVIVVGNLFVCGLEGLIVGIQVLRLEYYEMFSRFYKGTGREFTPINKKES